MAYVFLKLDRGRLLVVLKVGKEIDGEHVDQFIILKAKAQTLLMLVE
jgi:hypothetical protein